MATYVIPEAKLLRIHVAEENVCFRFELAEIFAPNALLVYDINIFSISSILGIFSTEKLRSLVYYLVS